MSGDIHRAEQQLTLFECKNIASDQLNHSPITAFHERTLSVSKDKAAQYIQQYKDESSLFNAPLAKVLQEQFIAYKAACEFLGGVTVDHLDVDTDSTH